MSAFFPNGWQGYLPICIVMFRLVGLSLFFPILSNRTIPAVIKAVLIFALSFAIYPLVRQHLPVLALDLGSLATTVIKEISFGMLLGFIAYLTFEAFSLGAHFIGYQMGFGSVSLMDPQHQSQVSTLVPLHSWLALILFLALDLHHEILALLVRSFEMTSSTRWDLLALRSVHLQILAVTGRLFVIAVQMAAPFTLVVLMVNVGLGVLAKIIPQMNVLFFSFPVTLLLGIITLYLFAPHMMSFIESILGLVVEDFVGVMRAM